MKPAYITSESIAVFIDDAFQEDLGEGENSGDHSSLASVPENQKGEAYIVAKEGGVLAGLDLATAIFEVADPTLEVSLLFEDGQTAALGDKILTVEGNARAILKAERLVLNCLQRMSGIATETREVVNLLEGTKTKILDTRKTTPNFRMMEKWAVHIGGGQNHRFGLFDMIMLKDNHVDFAGGISKAIEATSIYLDRTGLNLKVEIETRSLDEVRQVLNLGKVDIIMLDNMSLEEMKEAVQLIAGRYQTEASGGIGAEQVQEVAACGVNFISMGALTYAASSLDLSMKVS